MRRNHTQKLVDALQEFIEEEDFTIASTEVPGCQLHRNYDVLYT